MKYLHITDIHLDHLTPNPRPKTNDLIMKGHLELVKGFAKKITSINEVNDVFLTGDISSGELLISHLTILAEAFVKAGKRLHFVLGNHDFYNSSFQTVLEEVRNISTNHKFKKHLFYSTNKSYFDKNSSTLVVGSNGWYDGEYAPFFSTTLDSLNKSVEMNDFYLIIELNKLRSESRQYLYQECKRLAKDYAETLRQDIEFGILGKSPKHIAVLTHIPVFKELSTYNGKISDDTWLPCFSSKFMGDMLLEVSKKYPNINFHVFCGHSHGRAEYSPLSNLKCFTGKSQYGMPECSMFEGEIC